jgi:hypothetical protein
MQPLPSAGAMLPHNPVRSTPCVYVCTLLEKKQAGHNIHLKPHVRRVED